MYLPLARVTNADIKNAYSDQLARSWDGEQVLIGGVYRIGDELIDLGVYVRRAPDFCGGCLVHSPLIRVESMESKWGYPLAGIRYDDKAGADNSVIDELPDMKLFFDKWVETTGRTELHEYAAEVLAANVVNYMLSRSWMSAMASGKGEDNEYDNVMLDFAEAFSRVRTSPGYVFRVDGGVIPWRAEPMILRCENDGPQSVICTYNASQPFYNPNSGNEVSWYQLSIAATTMWRGHSRDYDLEYDEDEYNYDDVDREYESAGEAYCMPHHKAEEAQRSLDLRRSRVQHDMGESGYMSAMIQRSNWRNG